MASLGVGRAEALPASPVTPPGEMPCQPRVTSRKLQQPEAVSYPRPPGSSVTAQARALGFQATGCHSKVPLGGLSH